MSPDYHNKTGINNSDISTDQEWEEAQRRIAELEREKGNYKGSFEVLSERLERMRKEDAESRAKFARLLVMAQEMDVDSYEDVFPVKWLANRIVKEQGR